MYTPLPIKRSSHYGNNYWEVYSVKLKRTVRLFSDLEYDNWILIEGDPEVVSFCEQPLKLQIQLEGNSVESILDMWIKRSDGTEHFAEIKYSTELDPYHKNFSARSFRQIKAQQKWCEQNGFKYELRTEKEIRGNTILLENLKLILPYVRLRETRIDTDWYRALNLINEKPTTINQIEQYFSEIPKQRVRETICRLIYTGSVRTNIDTVPYNPETEVWIND